MTDFALTPPASPPAPRRARKTSPLGQLLLGILASQSGRLPVIDLVNEALFQLRQSGLPAHASNLYTRLRKMRDLGQIEVRRMDGARWACLPDQPCQGRRRHALKGRLSVRKGKASFRAQAAGLPAYAGEAVVTFFA